MNLLLGNLFVTIEKIDHFIPLLCSSLERGCLLKDRNRFFSAAVFLTFLAAFPVFLSAAPAAKNSAEKTLRAAPAFPAKGEWVNPPQGTRYFWKDKLTLVYFWDYTTINCIRELRLLKKWADAYQEQGLQLVLIHDAEFNFARKKENVEKAARRFGITQPILLDNDSKLWNAYGNRSWPARHLVNSEGKIVETRIGEGENIAFEIRIREELLKMDPSIKLPDPVVKVEKDNFNVWDCGEMSTELYVGYKRASWWGIEIANRPGVLPDQVLRYKDQGRRLERGLFLNGEWGNREEYMEHTQRLDDWTSYLGGIYLGAEVYAVMAKQQDTGREARIYVRRDDAPVPPETRGSDLDVDETGETFFILDEPRLYYLISGEDHEFHEIKVMTRDPGVSVYVFAFSNACLTDFDHR